MIPSEYIREGLRVILDNYEYSNSNGWPNNCLYSGYLHHTGEMGWCFVSDLYDGGFHDCDGATDEGYGWYIDRPEDFCSLEGPYQKPERKKNGFSKFINRIEGA